MIKEAGVKEGRESNVSNGGLLNNTESNVITRQSLTVLAGDENDLLSESPVFQKAKGAENQQRAGGPFEINP